MECEACRQALASDPEGRLPGVAEHLASCPACRAHRDELRALDERIARALAIETPELALPELPAAGGELVDLAGRGRPRPHLPALLAVAAGLAAVAILVLRGVGIDDAPGGYERLVQEILAHMDHEESSRVVTTVAVSDASLGQVLAGKVRSFDTGSAIVSYATSCVIDGHLVPHLVVQGRTGPITVILLPDEDVDEVVPLSGEAVHGFILPAETGSIAIIGQREEQMPEVAEVGERVVQSVKWSI